MTKQDLKHAIVSLLLGVATMAAYQLLEGFLHIAQAWIGSIMGGATTTVSYLKIKHYL